MMEEATPGWGRPEEEMVLAVPVPGDVILDLVLNPTHAGGGSAAEAAAAILQNPRTSKRLWVRIIPSYLTSSTHHQL